MLRYNRLQSFSRLLQCFSRRVRRQVDTTQSELSLHKDGVLERTLQEMRLSSKNNLILDQFNFRPRVLSNEEKNKLKLYLPKLKIRRMTLQTQQLICPEITSMLYKQQSQQGGARVKFLQNNLWLACTPMKIDYYINIIYKDIYARYLIIRGLKVQWDSFSANYGAVNSNPDSAFPSAAEYTTQSLSAIAFNFIEQVSSSAQLIPSIGIYSYRDKQFVSLNQVQIEKVTRIGSFIKMPLTDCGKHDESFRVLADKNQQVSLLVFVEYLEKLLRPDAIVVRSGEKMIILKRFINEQALNAEYLITAVALYSKHRKYFADQGYTNHQTFDSMELLTMASNALPIVPEISQYEREPGLYLACGSQSIADFERLSTQEFLIRENGIDADGIIPISGTVLRITDPQLQFQLQASFAAQGVEFLNLYQVFEDQLCSHVSTKEILKLRLTNKIHLPVGQEEAARIMDSLKDDGTIIIESKVEIPPLVKGKKPREKRKLQAQRDKLISQRTEYYTLQQSLESVDSISLSSVSTSRLRLPIILKNDTVQSYRAVLSPEEITALYATGQVNASRLQQRGMQVQYIFFNEDLLSSLQYIRSLQQDIKVIIEPQSQSEERVAHALHVNHLLKKGQHVKDNIKLILVHPTIKENQRDMLVGDILTGTMKANSQKQYGFGLEALRLWVALKDEDLGDRMLLEKDINAELEHSEFIRQCYSRLLSLLPSRANRTKPTNYLGQFMLDQIDYYILNMEQFYNEMRIWEAYKLTKTFFRDIVEEIFLQPVRRRIITYPNSQEHPEHFYVMERLLSVLPVLTPLIPFTAYFISGQRQLAWPQIEDKMCVDRVGHHNQMIRMRVELRNKISLNKFTHSQLELEKEFMSPDDASLFFDVDRTVTHSPQTKERVFRLRETPRKRQLHGSIYVHSYSDHCIRCDPHSKNALELCTNCSEYLRQNIDRELVYFPTNNQS